MARWPLALRPFAALAMAMLWPFGSLRSALKVAREAPYRPAGFWHLAWRAALSKNIPPREFADYQLFRKDIAQDWRYTRETVLLLGRTTPADTADLISDKRRFAPWLAAEGVAVVPLLDDLPEGQPVVTKPQRGMQGRGITAWHWTGENYRAEPGFGPAGREELTAEALRARVHDEILQPLIPPGLEVHAVARLITGTGGAYDALIQTPKSGDFCTHRGPFRLVDLAEGLILRPGPGQTGSIYGDGSGKMPLEGTYLPGWGGIVADLTALHARMSAPPPLIGWDLIWGPKGPMVLEGNT
ncbi:MAG: hypothetical protein AAGI13_03435, partial [Pseudomonadota bacterium]